MKSTKAIPDKKSENNQECDGTSCKKVYGRMGKKLSIEDIIMKRYHVLNAVNYLLQGT